MKKQHELLEAAMRDRADPVYAAFVRSEQATVAAARAAAAAASPPLQAVDQPRMPSGRAPAAVGVAPRSSPLLAATAASRNAR